MRRTVCLAMLIVLMLTGAMAMAQAASASGALQFRAQMSFNSGKYAEALPIFQKLAVDLKDQPDKVGVIEEQIRVCQRNIAAGITTPPLISNVVPSTNPAPVDAQAAAADRPPTAESRTVHIPPKDKNEVVVMDIKELANFDYDAEHGGNIPADVQALNGYRFRTHGFMVSLAQADNITDFVLVPSLFSCCFGMPPQVQHSFIVHCPKGKAVSYCPDEIQVEGVLTVQEKKDDGYVVSIFEIQATSVKQMPR